MSSRSSLLQRLASAATLLLLACFMTGCSTFQRDWKAASKSPTPVDNMEGRWEGTWKSEASGHTDKLRCLMTRTADGKYQARFRAKYHTVLTFNSTAMLDAKSQDGKFTFTGSADLGAFGIYHYDGNATPTNFVSSYTCSYDHGTFNMTRPVEK